MSSELTPGDPLQGPTRQQHQPVLPPSAPPDPPRDDSGKLGWKGWGGLVVVALVVIGMISGGDDKQKPATSSSKASASATQNSAPAAEPDSGRMSDGEFDAFQHDHSKWESEVQDYGTDLGGKCATMASVGQLAEFFECEDDAWDGVIGAYSLADDDWRGLRDDVAKSCRRALARSVKTLNGFADSIVAVHDMASKGQLRGAVLGEAVRRFVTGKRKAYSRSYARTSSACSPT